MRPVGARTHVEERGRRRGRWLLSREMELSLPYEAYKRYILCMSPHPLSVSDARQRLAAVIEQATTTGEPVYLERHGRRVAAVIGAEQLDQLIELAEDMADIRAAEEARHEMRETAALLIPWEQAKVDLGLS